MEKLKVVQYKKVNATYLPTAKNRQVSDFYEKLGFEITDEKLIYDGSKNYTLNLSKNIPEIKPFYKLIEN